MTEDSDVVTSATVVRTDQVLVEQTESAGPARVLLLHRLTAQQSGREKYSSSHLPQFEESEAQRGQGSRSPTAPTTKAEELLRPMPPLFQAKLVQTR